MGRRLLYTLVLLAAGAFSLGAQERRAQGGTTGKPDTLAVNPQSANLPEGPVVEVDTLAIKSQTASLLDGPVVKVDTLENRPGMLPSVGRPGFLRSYRSPSSIAPSPFSPSLVPPGGFEFETKEQFAARINASTYAAVMRSIDGDLYWHRMPKYSKPVRVVMDIASLFLSNPFGFREGYVPLMNESFPFIFAATPGWAPYEHPYSTEAFPQSIGVEFDLATGTYKQKALDWSDVQKNITRSFGGSFKYEPVPKVPVTPVERAMQQH